LKSRCSDIGVRRLESCAATADFPSYTGDRLQVRCSPRQQKAALSRIKYVSLMLHASSVKMDSLFLGTVSAPDTHSAASDFAVETDLATDEKGESWTSRSYQTIELCES